MNTHPIPLSFDHEREDKFPLLAILAVVALGVLICLASVASLHLGNAKSTYSAPALFNQANAYAHEGKTGLAILFYQRARLLAPQDANIAANLQWVREHAGLPTPSEGWQDHARSWMDANTLACLGTVGLILLGAGILSAKFLPNLRPIPSLGLFAGIVLLALSLVGAFVAWPASHEAVVIATDAPARISPVNGGETSFTLHAGEAIAVRGKYQDYALIENSSGHTGWVAQDQIMRVIPNS